MKLCLAQPLLLSVQMNRNWDKTYLRKRKSMQKMVLMKIADDINFFMDNFTAEEAEDYSGVRDPGAFRSFQLATAYYLTCSEDSSEGITIPPGSASWSSLRTSKTTTPRATTGTAGRTHR